MPFGFLSNGLPLVESMQSTSPGDLFVESSLSQDVRVRSDLEWICGRVMSTLYNAIVEPRLRGNGMFAEERRNRLIHEARMRDGSHVSERIELYDSDAGQYRHE